MSIAGYIFFCFNLVLDRFELGVSRIRLVGNVQLGVLIHDEIHGLVIREYRVHELVAAVFAVARPRHLLLVQRSEGYLVRAEKFDVILIYLLVHIHQRRDYLLELKRIGRLLYQQDLEGSVVEELVKKLPGAEVSDDGKITINGKQVKKILVDGKEFMTGDTQTALKNLPTSIVDRIKAYDEKSDLSRITGIDDGDEQTVLDSGLKRGMNRGFGNLDLAVGTHNRYAERVMAALFKDKYRIMFFGSANNTNDMGFPGGGGGRGGRGGARNGLNSSKMVGVNFNFEETGLLKADASIRWNHSDGDALSKQSAENFVGKESSFSNSNNQNYTRSNSWNGQMRLEWTPDTMTNIMFRPNFTISSNDGNQRSTSATYNKDPYLYVDQPLSEEGLKKLAEWSYTTNADGTIDSSRVLVNTRDNINLSYGKSTSLNGMLQFNRKLNNRGRNFTLRVDGNYSDNDNTSLSVSRVSLYQIGLDSTYYTNRYSLTPSTRKGYSLQATYSEPIARTMFLQFSYRYNYSTNESDRSTYDFSRLGGAFSQGVSPEYRSWQPFLSHVPGNFNNYLDKDLSRYSEYKNYIHDIQLTYRWIQPKFQLNAGFMVQPQRSHYTQDYQGVYVDTVRNVTNMSPTLDFRYRFSNLSNLRIIEAPPRSPVSATCSTSPTTATP